MTPSLYIHIPFCKRKCIYCNFYSDIYDENTARSFVDALVPQIGLIDFRPSTIYIGGGTPSALAVGLLSGLLKSLQKVMSPGAEFTIEANPESLSEDNLKLFLDHGVNRLSIGVQSMRGEKLRKLGRIHSAAKAKESVCLASRRGFSNISVDLIFGVWGESPESWKKELEEAVRLPITHVSCYELTYEKDTPLYEALENKSVAPLDEDETASMYEAAIGALALRGIKQYEVSNFARPGYECAHNMNYWENNEYLGLGPSAVSYLNGVRRKNISDINEYLLRFEEERSLIESEEKLSPIKRARETAAIKIRTRDGIDFKWFKEKTGYDFLELEKGPVSSLIEEGLIKYKKSDDIPSGVMLKRKGFLFCDTVSSAFM
jgi:oxygen-independent coproporphyrinogen-3 oxidase